MTKCLVHSIQEWEEKIKPALDAAIITAFRDLVMPGFVITISPNQELLKLQQYEWEEKIKPALDAAIIEKVFWKVSCRDNSTYLVMASSYEEAAKRVIETKTVAFTDKGMGANCGSHWRFITSIQQLDYQIL